MNFTAHHLETPPDVVDGDEALAVDVDDLEPLDVRLDLVLAEVDGDLVATGAVDHLAHLVGQEVAGRLDLPLRGEGGGERGVGGRRAGGSAVPSPSSRRRSSAAPRP